MTDTSVIDWSLAVCAQTDPELFFFDDKGGSNKQAKRLCNGDGKKIQPCPIRSACLTEGLSGSDELDGVWGGLAPRERSDIRQGRTERPW